MWALRRQAEAQYSTVERARAKVAVRSIVASAPQLEPASCHDAWSQLYEKWLEVSAVRERPVQRYSEEFGLGAEGQGFVVEVDFQLTLSVLDVAMENCRHHFCSAEFQLPGLEMFTYGRHVFA